MEQRLVAPPLPTIAGSWAATEQFDAGDVTTEQAAGRKRLDHDVFGGRGQDERIKVVAG